MTEKIEQQEAEAAEFGDELSDEALAALPRAVLLAARPIEAGRYPTVSRRVPGEKS
jgi:hypothetical protein